MNSKILAYAAFLGVIALIVGNVLDSDTYWIYSDIYGGVVLLLAGWKLLKG
jgi:hypothetical protein